MTTETASRLDGDFDYIVVGAGSAGCVLANRLSADPRNRVLVLEAGGRDNWIWFHIPAGYLFAIGNPRADWMFQTEKEPGLNGRALNYPRGKVIGGCSAINGMISMRGQSQDYDHWRQLGLTGWGWDDVAPVFRRLDSHFLGDTEHHGAGGEWRVEESRVRWEVLDAVIKAANELGIPQTGDFNTGDNTGVGYFHVNQKRGVRMSAARAFLKPVLKRPNLRLETGVLVEKLSFEGKRCTGVLYRQGGRLVEARAKSEVILAAGAVGSPQILQLSGIGAPDWLGEVGIPVLHAREGVGRNLQDHLQQRAIYKVNGVKTLNMTYHSLVGRALMGMQYALLQKGPLTMSPSQLGIFTRSSPDQERSNIEFHVQPLSLDKFGEPLHRFPAIARHDQAAVGRSIGQARHRAQLSCDLRGPHGGGGCYSRDAAPDAPTRDAALSSGGISAGPRRGRRRCLSRQGGRRHRHHDLPPRRDREDGAAVGSARRGRQAAEGHRSTGAARGRRVGHADHHVGQHQHAHDHDRRQGGWNGARRQQTWRHACVTRFLA